MQFEAGELLSKINDPSDLKKLKEDQLEQLSQELRQFIIDQVSVNGGHFAASLGVVELTVALHYVMNTPYDQLIWDVGHQAYGHKILTGRRDIFHTNRIENGISGFPNRFESQYDAFGVGHSSTSISAALGMAVASQIKGEKDRQHIAVIGDGALTGGMAFEALNHAGISKSNLLVILNDNCMSIDPNVGALKEYLTSITTSKRYNRFRDDIAAVLTKISEVGPNALGIAKKLEKSIKGTLLKNANLFESLNFRYFGPVDGHDVKKLAKTLEDLKHIPGPKLLHAVTIKGKGFALAEKDQTKWHAPGLFDKITGEIKKSLNDKPVAPKFQDVFGHTLVELAEENDKIVGITPAMPSGSSLNIMMKAMPDRAFDVGIAEQHAVTFSAGLATQGLLPFCNIYSSFMQRAYDQVIHDVALQNLNVVFCLDRAGVVGADGATHHGAYDIAFMRCVPNMTVSAPMNEEELRNLMYTAQLPNKGPFVIRYPRGNGVMPDWRRPFTEIEIGKGRLISAGEELAILSFGAIGNEAVKAVQQLNELGIHPAHYDLRFAKPLDEALLHQVFQKFDKIITVEDGSLQGGIGSAVLEFMADHGYHSQVVRLGIPDKIIEHAEQNAQWKHAHYDADAIVSEAKKLCNGKLTSSMVG
ncbi:MULTISPECIES: 1-deoxy-D-xylulose-5-phosphate synthase [Sphingobacterium]|jgi:1-deoxy-D-xylulose-5-phosphate synthase|uniref:1-deoxy-D-xylulose-5-phosphate synthase n=1 Tax=Sphingobacterium multivorum TaxID=28454 RepID=A0A2X2J888_SPHMU|nr:MULTISPECIES: 1-deoxy-D-xylulose-5-phosphate synthase [Sphingobacterium]HCX56763.1 1-deoxy-D-xylulose-5-phosphate synthase [Sphingobacterium sp.]OFV18499.1 1-deoxy-D-xylulose-5-phosphate synthase [Sphingobacterium sp. HMSC13C05]QQT63742.1 1-deoxy-D-xylulose-5-phosphate synthase [Sphingobacterium multivorum]QRQ61009.1 1-deoxy-D-xylulose-5-phosphate synthase [Sphingobacterium multivorum]SPZ88086.1 1-deoxy-D-xylulose-5-phosphate synthase [Sphingobacterium multivorum]